MMNAHQLAWPVGAREPQAPPATAWLAAPLALRSPLWPAIGVALLFLGLLWAFHDVVVGSVKQSQLRHAATAAHDEASWRCKLLSGRAQRDSCRASLDAADGVHRALQGEGGTPAAAVAQSSF